ncbi:hypothetical protein [Bacillus thuringiensis]|uniref:hypothetical protein n=1 Tax=Bacillus thuringiensis TaxID=1428 RepID=UPI001482567E|nr:hypothetical protein [Bacillus thuringiensis]
MEKKGMNISSNDINIDENGRVFITNKLLVDFLKDNAERGVLPILGDVNCVCGQ